MVDAEASKKHRRMKEGSSESFICCRTSLCLCFTSTVNSNMEKRTKKEIINQDTIHRNSHRRCSVRVLTKVRNELKRPKTI